MCIHRHALCISDLNSSTLIERRLGHWNVSGSIRSNALGPSLYYLLDPSFIMMMVWGLAPGDDSDASLYLDLVIMGCEKKTNVSQEKKNVALVVVHVLYCCMSQP